MCVVDLFVISNVWCCFFCYQSCVLWICLLSVMCAVDLFFIGNVCCVAVGKVKELAMQSCGSNPHILKMDALTMLPAA